jgi:uncharacterized protein with von Willebrand factor type A (vWA) domain
VNVELEPDPGLELPLIELFYRLREAKLPLGIAEYELLPRAMMAGFGFEGVESLKDLCRMLWIKTPDEEVIFNHIFSEYIEERPPAGLGQDSDEGAGEGAEEAGPAAEETDAGETSGDEQGKMDEPAPPEPVSGSSPTEPGPAEPGEPRQPTEQPAEPGEDDGSRAARLEALRRKQAEKRSSKIELAGATTGVYDEAAHFLVAGGGRAARGRGERSYSFRVDYLPITTRQMKQSWRYLRKAVRDGPPVELDVEATVDKVASEGRYYQPVMRPRRINRAAMILLIDQEGSMTPFHGFSRRLEETALRGGRLGQTNVYYFNNCPLDVLYCNPYFSESRPLEAVMRGLHPTRTAVLIFSDAGAARDRYSYERVDMTRAFLRRLYQSVRYVAWLNPMPSERWAHTSAAAIARSVPMFEISREGLQNAISIMRGRAISRR